MGYASQAIALNRNALSGLGGSSLLEGMKEIEETLYRRFRCEESKKKEGVLSFADKDARTLGKTSKGDKPPCLQRLDKLNMKTVGLLDWQSAQQRKNFPIPQANQVKQDPIDNPADLNLATQRTLKRRRELKTRKLAKTSAFVDWLKSERGISNSSYIRPLLYPFMKSLLPNFRI
ncbi:hypothetical protein CCACVL1_02281 [Corchorus capsularis]|uniref:Uncharacterized protein n=1 Tax=Corchorus capsularis TaxID=210143 RepID=A0A1R3K9P2_COCAP|nr:hypothetical protein CCACVL1_02281 [Corchorus capsularis]